MPTYVAFLRAINVGGRTVKMDKLCSLFGELGLQSVESFIASGNIIFSSIAKGRAGLEAKIEGHLAKSLGYEVATFLRTVPELAAIAEHPAVTSKEAASAGALNVALLKGPLSAAAVKSLKAMETDIDRLVHHQSEVYWICKTKQSQSRFSNVALERGLKSQATFRGLSTMQRLAKKLAADAK